MKRKFLPVICLFIVCLLMLSSCGNATLDAEKYEEFDMQESIATDSFSYSENAEVKAFAPDANGLATAATGSAKKPITGSERKIIYSSNFDIQTKNYTSSIETLKSLCEKYNAYFERSDTYGNDGNSRYSNYSVRVPVENYSSFIGETGSIGTVVSSSEYNEDITEQYVDTSARLDSAKLREERVLEILKNAGDLDDVLALEKELADIRYEIETYTGSLRRFDSLVNYSTVSISISEVNTIVGTPQKLLTFGERTSLAFANGINDFCDGFQDFVVFVSYHFIGLIVFIAVILVFVIIITSVNKKNRKKKKLTDESASKNSVINDAQDSDKQQ